MCVCVCVCVRSFLPPRASRPRNIGTYVFTATRKTLYNYSASFRSYGRRNLLASKPLTAPELQNMDIIIPTESTQRGHEITIRDFN